MIGGVGRVIIPICDGPQPETGQQRSSARYIQVLADAQRAVGQLGFYLAVIETDGKANGDGSRFCIHRGGWLPPRLV